MVSEIKKKNYLKFDDSLKKEAVTYIERCHLEDGGYFFARVPPSSGLDTYFAVKSLSLLGVPQNKPETIADFFLNQYRDGALTGTTAIFSSVETLSELGKLTGDLKKYAKQQIIPLQNKAGGFGALENIDIEVSSELQETYRAINVLKTIGAEYDKRKVTDFVLGDLNSDGGFGRVGRSTLASTYYATEILKLSGYDMNKLTGTREYLRKIERNWQVEFIEDIYWLVSGLANLGEKAKLPDKIVNFVTECRRTNGGFSRATEIGIPTLEYTFYALSILKEIVLL